MIQVTVSEGPDLLAASFFLFGRRSAEPDLVVVVGFKGTGVVSCCVHLKQANPASERPAFALFGRRLPPSAHVLGPTPPLRRRRLAVLGWDHALVSLWDSAAACERSHHVADHIRAGRAASQGEFGAARIQNIPNKFYLITTLQRAPCRDTRRKKASDCTELLFAPWRELPSLGLCV